MFANCRHPRVSPARRLVVVVRQIVLDGGGEDPEHLCVDVPLLEVEDAVVGLDDVGEVGEVGADDHDVVPDLPVVVVALDRLLQHLPRARLLAHLDVRVRQVVPHLEVLKRGRALEITFSHSMVGNRNLNL